MALWEPPESHEPGSASASGRSCDRGVSATFELEAVGVPEPCGELTGVEAHLDDGRPEARYNESAQDPRHGSPLLLDDAQLLVEAGALGLLPRVGLAGLDAQDLRKSQTCTGGERGHARSCEGGSLDDALPPSLGAAASARCH